MARQLAYPASITGETLRVGALDRLRHTQGSVQLGSRRLDLGNVNDFEIAKEQAFFSPEVIQACWDEIHRQAPGNQALQEFFFRHVFNVPGHLQTREQLEIMRVAAAQPGGLVACQRRLILAMGGWQ
jgi:hypothetical protein